MTKNKIQFLLKLISKYFIYGYLCLIGIALILILTLYLYKSYEYPLKIMSFIILPFSLPLFAQFLRILISTNYKYRYYMISIYRLHTHGFKSEYFEAEMHEPCFKIIIKDILCSNGYYKEFILLQEKCKGRNIRVENAKIKLLKKVERMHNVIK